MASSPRQSPSASRFGGPAVDGVAAQEGWFVISDGGRSALRIVPGLQLGETLDGLLTFAEGEAAAPWLVFRMKGSDAWVEAAGGVSRLTTEAGEPLERQPLAPGLVLAFPDNQVLVSRDIMPPPEPGPVIRVEHLPVDPGTVARPEVEVAEAIPEPFGSTAAAAPRADAAGAAAAAPTKGGIARRPAAGPRPPRRDAGHEPPRRDALRPLRTEVDDEADNPPASRADVRGLVREWWSAPSQQRPGPWSALVFAAALVLLLLLVSRQDGRAVPHRESPVLAPADRAPAQRPLQPREAPAARAAVEAGTGAVPSPDPAAAVEPLTGADLDEPLEARRGIAPARDADTPSPPGSEPLEDSAAVADLVPEAPVRGGPAGAPFEDPRIAQARTLLEAGRITYPPGGNAVELLVAVLEDRPGHQEALSLLGDCTDRLIRQAMEAYAAGREYEARNTLEDLLGFNPENERANRLWDAWMEPDS